MPVIQFSSAQWPRPWLKVIKIVMPLKVFAGNTILQTFMTAVMIIHKKWQCDRRSKTFCQLLWPWMKVTSTKGFSTEQHRASFHNICYHTVRENANVWSFKIFQQPLFPWPWMKVKETGMVWKASQQSTFVPRFMTANSYSVRDISKCVLFYIWHWPPSRL